jgi:hypothetical protein
MAKQTYTSGQVLSAAQMTTLQTNDYNQTVNAKTASYTLVASDVGTRITMTSASATTITVNTALFAAGDTLEIVNLGAGACTITAGTATVSTAGSLALTQYEGGYLFFNTTSAAIFFDYHQAASAGGGAAGIYQSKDLVGSTYYIRSGNSSTLSSTVTGNLTTLSRTYYLPIIVSTGTATKLAVRTDTGFTGVGCTVRLGIYNNDATLNIPTTVLLDGGTVSPLVASTVYEVTISQPLTAGLYYLAAKITGYTSGQNSYNGTGATGISPLGMYASTANNALTGTTLNGYQETQTAGALVTAGTLAATSSTLNVAIGY